MVSAWQAYRLELDAVLNAGDRDQTLRLFMRLAGSSAQDVAGAEAAPVWPALRGAGTDAALRRGMPRRRPAARKPSCDGAAAGAPDDRHRGRLAHGGASRRLLRCGSRRCRRSTGRHPAGHPRGPRATWPIRPCAVPSSGHSSPADATAGGILDVVPRELPAVVETSGGATEGGPVGQRSLVQQLDGVRQPPRMEQGPDGLPAGGSGHQRHSVCVVEPAEEQSP